MNRSRVIRRALTLAGATASAMAVTFAMATPALACHPDLQGGCTSFDQQTWTVTWTVENVGGGKTATVEAVNVQPAAEFKNIKKDVTFTSGSKLTEVQVIPQSVEEVTLSVTLDWNAENPKTDTLTINKKEAKCDAPAPSPSPSASPTTPPVETPPATPPATTAPPAPGEGGGLPVTGTAVGGIAGAAAVLLAIGAGLFVMARRRRIRFTA